MNGKRWRGGREMSEMPKIIIKDKLAKEEVKKILGWTEEEYQLAKKIRL